MSELRIAAAVLIGGRSSRMGNPKEDLIIPDDGRTFFEKICDEIDICYDKCISERYISVRKGQEKIREGYTVIEDEYDDIGPLGGLYAALKKACEDKCDAVLLLACDMIKYNSEEIMHICGMYKGQDILFSRTQGDKLQPLASIYGVNILKGVDKNIHENIYKLRGLIDHCGSVGFYEPDNEAAYININTPIKEER